MERVSPWYIITRSPCKGCRRSHEYGPFPCEEDANAAIEGISVATSRSPCDLMTIKRPPMSDDQLIRLITEQCTMAIGLVMDMQTPNDFDPAQCQKMVINLVQSGTVNLFMQYRPGCTVEYMHEILVGTVDDTIGDTVGGVQ